MRPRLRRRIPLIAGTAALLIHLAGNPHYGFFRDELYFIICGRHPALGYVDQPPLVPLLAAFSQSFGTSLIALRAIAALFAGVATYVACLFAYELGGELFAVAFAGLLTIVSPVMMAFGARVSPDMVEYATWTLIALWVLRITRGANPRWWLAVGALAAIAGWSKYSVAFFVPALIVGLALTPERRVLRSGWFTGGVVLAFALIAPNAWWQWQHHWPMLQLLHNDYGRFLLASPPFPLQQIVIMSPLLSLEWVIGLGWLLWERPTRFLGYAYLGLIAAMWFLDSKSYYPAAIYPYLIAAGAIPIERWSARRPRLRVALIAMVIAFAIPSTPFVLPVLPIRTFVAYQVFLGRIFHVDFHVDPRANNHIPIQYYADMTGWRQLVREVARIDDSLPPAQRARAGIYAHNFGEASAIDFYGRQYGLPRAMSGNDTYWIWGPHAAADATIIDVNGRELLPLYRSIRLARILHTRYAMPYENNIPVWVLRGPREPLKRYWPRLKDYSYVVRSR